MPNCRLLPKKSGAPGKLMQGAALLVFFWLGAILPVHASTFVFQWDDSEPILTGNTYQDGVLIQSVAVGPESYNGTYGLWNNALLAASFDLRFNIFEPDRVTLSETWQLFGTQGNSFLGIPFFSDVEGGPALTPLIDARSIIESGDYQEVARFTVSNGDLYIWQFRSTPDAVVPEPATLALLGLGLAGLAAIRRRKLN